MEAEAPSMMKEPVEVSCWFSLTHPTSLGGVRVPTTLGGVKVPRRGEDVAIEAVEDAHPNPLVAREKSWL